MIFGPKYAQFVFQKWFGDWVEKSRRDVTLFAKICYKLLITTEICCIFARTDVESLTSKKRTAQNVRPNFALSKTIFDSKFPF